MRLSTIALLAAVCVATPVLADDPATAPTKEQLDAAKKAFEDGNALFKAGKLDEAVIKLKESYRLSRNAFLLYNIGHTYDQLGQKELVLFYYRKFLAAAPATAPMRESVQKRVTALEAENVQVVTPEGETAENDSTTGTPGPTSKYSGKDFKHETIDAAPPGWPIDITAAVPADAGFVVKLFYRASGDASFISKPMTWRNYELVARIPGTKATGKIVQYYIEVRDGANKLVIRSGKSTSPHLINIEPNTKKQYYEDYVDEGGEVVAPVPVDGATFGQQPGETRNDRASTAFTVAKWASTGVALGLFTTSIISYKMAGDQHDKLVADASQCGAPPCREWDESFGERVQTLGQRWDTAYKVTLVAGIATAGVATYLWIRDLRRKPYVAPKENYAPAETAWLIAPVIGEHFAGATALAEF